MPEEEIAEALKRFRSSPLPWRDRRRAVIDRFMNRFDATRPEIERAFKDVLPAMSTAAAWKKLRSAATLRSLGVDEGFIARWRAVDDDGPLHDEVRARFEGVPVRFSHAIVDEAQDLSIFGLRAVQRRAKGLTLVGDDAQRSAPNAIGLERAAQLLGSELEEMTTAYRMSAEIAEWLNHHAQRHDLPAVRLVGVRPIGLNVATTGEQPSAAAARLAREWSHVAVINHDDVWDHKGVEYDAVQQAHPGRHLTNHNAVDRNVRIGNPLNQAPHISSLPKLPCSRGDRIHLEAPAVDLDPCVHGQ